ncbi:MAG: cell wall-binding repeat-containing protein [Bacillota bacterium]|nr:cell wall-binding repeat-containing protein [Bacillota bacterium]
MVKKRKSISLITSTVMAASIFNFSTFIPVQAASDAVFTSDRISGADRFETAAKIADKGWTTTSDYAVIATGEDYPDALCASPLAKKYNAPIILTKTYILSNSAKKELKRLSVKNVFIVGGTAAVSSDVENQIKSLGINPTRIAGANRYETSLKVAKQLDKPSAISIATGNDFADALSFASIAAMKGDPILLSDKNSIDDGIKQYINDNSSTITTSYVIGGTGVVSDSVLNSLKNPVRLSGKNRYETNTAVLNYFKKDLDLSNVYLATGNDFPDALASSVLASNSKTPILLVNNTIDPSTVFFVNDNTTSIKNITAIGGTNAVSDSLLANASENFGNFEIKFEDATLKSTLQKILGKTDSEPILKKDVDKITDLDLGETGISNLDGIQYFTSLTKLNIGIIGARGYNKSNTINDLSPLLNLKKLQYLDASGIDNVYLSPLSTLPNLQDLILNNCNLSDISELKNFTSLKNLDLSINAITNISALSNLTSLQSLNLSYNKVTDIKDISSLANLQSIYLSANNISDFSSLKNLKNLSALDIRYNKETDISFLNSLTGLTNLSLQLSDISDETPLSSLINLEIFNCSDSSYLKAQQVIPVIKNLKNIKILDFGDSYLLDISGIDSITSLQTLNLDACKLTDISDLSGLTNLQKLDLSYNLNLSDITPLKKLVNLKELYLTDTKATDTDINALKAALPNCIIK